MGYIGQILVRDDVVYAVWEQGAPFLNPLLFCLLGQFRKVIVKKLRAVLRDDRHPRVEDLKFIIERRDVFGDSVKNGAGIIEGINPLIIQAPGFIPIGLIDGVYPFVQSIGGVLIRLQLPRFYRFIGEEREKCQGALILLLHVALGLKIFSLRTAFCLHLVFGVPQIEGVGLRNQRRRKRGAVIGKASLRKGADVQPVL